MYYSFLCTYFSRVGTDLINHLSQLSSVGRELDAAARLQLFRDFFKGSEPAAFAFDLREHMKKGHSFKDWLCPDSMEFQKDHFRIDERWGRVLYLQAYATYIKDSMIAELCDMDRSLMPVSYTHLDVYKRQSQSSSRAIWDSASSAAVGKGIPKGGANYPITCLLYTSRCV